MSDTLQAWRAFADKYHPGTDHLEFVKFDDDSVPDILFCNANGEEVSIAGLDEAMWDGSYWDEFMALPELIAVVNF